MKALLASLILLVSFSAQSQIFQKTIHFENDEFIIDDADKLIIAGIVDFINDETKIISAIEIYGFADSNASINYNIELSKKRATAVSDIIRPQLNSELNNKIVVSWYGEIKPDAINKNLNYSSRSVDVIVAYSEIRIEKQSISELYDLLRTPVQKFTIDPERDTILTGEYGTVVFINANSFYIPKSCEGESVDILMQESYDAVSMFLNRLTTTSGNEQLESDGMLFLNAQVCNRVLTVKEDNPLTIMMPAPELKDSMQLFSGNREENGVINWELSANNLTPVNTTDLANILTHGDFYYYENRPTCPLFFCQVRTVFTGGNYKSNSFYQKRKFKFKAYRTYTDSICKLYGFKSYHALYQMLEQQRKLRFTEGYKSGEISISEWNYYMTSTSRLGWMNCDRFSKTPPFMKTDVMVAEAPAENISVNLVFRKFKSIMTSNGITDNSYMFNGIKKNQECYLVVLKYENKKPLMSIQKISITPNLVIDPEFKEYTVEEMKKELKRIGV